MNINQAINLCGYDETIKKDFVTFLQNNYSNDKTKLFLFTRNENAPKLFIMQIQIPSTFNGQIYDISVLCYFPRNFPNSPPELYFEKINSVKINPKCTFYVNEENLNIKYELFFNWENSFESFINLIEEIKHQFSFCFPIFNLPDGDEKEITGDCILPIDSIQEVIIEKPVVKEEVINPNFNPNQNFNENYDPNQNYNPNDFDINNFEQHNQNINNDNLNPQNQNNYNNNNLNPQNQINYNNDINPQNQNNNNNNNFNPQNKNINNNNNFNPQNQMNYNNNNINPQNQNLNNKNFNPPNQNNYNNNNFNSQNQINYNNNNNNNFNPQNQRNPNSNNQNQINNFNQNINNNNFNNIQNPHFNNPFLNQQNNNNQIQNISPIQIDEKLAKRNLIKKIILNVLPKVRNQFFNIGIITKQIETLQNELKAKLNKLNELDSKAEQLNDTVNSLQQEIINYAFQMPEKIDLSDLSNLDNLITIQNKDKYIKYAKENSLEELLVLIKKAFEKKSIDIKTASMLIRIHSRFIFYLKYKDSVINEISFNFN